MASKYSEAPDDAVANVGSSQWQGIRPACFNHCGSVSPSRDKAAQVATNSAWTTRIACGRLLAVHQRLLFAMVRLGPRVGLKSR